MTRIAPCVIAVAALSLSACTNLMIRFNAALPVVFGEQLPALRSEQRQAVFDRQGNRDIEPAS